MARQTRPDKGRVLPTILPEIRSLIEMSRHHAAVTANLALVNLYWNIGRIISQDIQKNPKRADYGEQLLDSLAKSLTQEYGRGYSISNLNDMRRFFENFQILQTVSVESSKPKVRQSKSSGFEGLQPLATESLVQQISQTVSDRFHEGKILQTLSGESSSEAIRQALPAESSDRILIDVREHFHLGWSHYRLLLSQSDPLKRKFYFGQAGTQRWSVRELQRQIEGALFDGLLSRAALGSSSLSKREKARRKSYDTRIFSRTPTCWISWG